MLEALQVTSTCTDLVGCVMLTFQQKVRGWAACHERVTKEMGWITQACWACYDRTEVALHAPYRIVLFLLLKNKCSYSLTDTFKFDDGCQWEKNCEKVEMICLPSVNSKFGDIHIIS